ncbi:rhomboid family intramembrane serine protease [Streptomyces sp. BE20]|uniref:rhomboid family intramembrane serine protease n=1 Tax=Streptomycetaceae TaxID=2062 RepID=UPI002E7A966B|nr:rhomboid family intramembrane serine protease [Streptomyces sp. BE20]MEE1828455.1 rhomboid family intramembrane serine protease [Streptomyces sp. BE20]
MAPRFARLLRDSRLALFTMLGVLAVIWAVQVANWLDDYRLSYEYGMSSGRLDELPDMFTMPLLHFGWDHIQANSWPLFAFGFLSAYRGVKRFLLATLLIVVAGGLTVWLFERPDAVTAGASGLVYGYFGYVVLRGIFDRNLVDTAIGVVVGALYSYLLLGVLPSAQGVSWLGHLGGLIGGLAGAWLLRDRAPKAAAAPTPAPAGPAGPGSALLRELDDLGI